ncbi:hypothetical protein [Prosthecobacter sp.]|uniref:hypothetical protein n=1 Tax=Prosthecobacter sp. TaxID=1965333 RepID=UPI00378495ED
MKHTLLTILLLSCSTLWAQTAAPAPKITAPAEVQLRGTLEQRLAIGGETTGWVLRHGGGKERVQVLLPAEAFGWIRDGMVVAVTGVYGTKHYPERGEVAVFIVKKITQVVH